MMSNLQSKHMDDQGRIDYVALAEDAAYTDFQQAVCEFQKMTVSSMTIAQRKAFFINLYNLVVLHANAQVGIPQSDMARYSFFDKVGYEVEGFFFSL